MSGPCLHFGSKKCIFVCEQEPCCDVWIIVRAETIDSFKVFITFESALSQARCLSHMSRGILDAPEEQHMYTDPDGEITTLFFVPCSTLFLNVIIFCVLRCSLVPRFWHGWTWFLSICDPPACAFCCRCALVVVVGKIYDACVRVAVVWMVLLSTSISLSSVVHDRRQQYIVLTITHLHAHSRVIITSVCPCVHVVRFQEVPARDACLAGVGGSLRKPSRQSHPQGRCPGACSSLPSLFIDVLAQICNR